MNLKDYAGFNSEQSEISGGQVLSSSINSVIAANINYHGYDWLAKTKQDLRSMFKADPITDQLYERICENLDSKKQEIERQMGL